MLYRCSSPNKYKRLDAKLERKMVEAKKGFSGYHKFKSINSIIMKFPQLRDSLKNIRAVFEQYDEDSNGTIDQEELKKCLQKLQLHLTEEEVEDLFHSCDIDGHEGIQFNEFIVLLCLIYLLKGPSSNTTSRLGSPQLEATFDTVIEVFLFLDKNGNGKLNKNDMVKALNDASPREKSPSHITRTRFEEMDWDRNGQCDEAAVLVLTVMDLVVLTSCCGGRIKRCTEVCQKMLPESLSLSNFMFCPSLCCGVCHGVQDESTSPYPKA
ncbi:hypothetical protein I3760_02G066300 [Carya illinoinensis]|nr:hypothetical protein I3760_02G066300 [Carya illinoinensis]